MSFGAGTLVAAEPGEARGGNNSQSLAPYSSAMPSALRYSSSAASVRSPRDSRRYAYGPCRACDSISDRQILEDTKSGDGARLEMLVLHDHAKRAYAYGST